MDKKVIGAKIRALRARQGLTTVTLADKVRMSQAQVSRLENGLQGFRSATLLRFCKVLKVPPVYFFVDGEDVSSRKVAEELQAAGLTPTRALRRALADPAFLRFAEKCARAHFAHKKNLLRMRKAVQRV
jgi:transcriptional regulator with XRE-family HTH domain